MTNAQTKTAINKVFQNVFDQPCPYSLDEILSKFAFDIKLPQKVTDSTTGETTWATSINPAKFITEKNSRKKDTWMQPKRPINNLDQLIEIWNRINFRTAERNYNSENVTNSDTVYRSEHVYRSCDSSNCKYLIFSDGCHQSEYLLASQRSGSCNFCIRVDDSFNCTNSYNISCSSKVSNSLFIEDGDSLHECIFCAHIHNQKFCIANMQFEESEYYAIKTEIIKWILSS